MNIWKIEFAILHAQTSGADKHHIMVVSECWDLEELMGRVSKSLVLPEGYKVEVISASFIGQARML